MQAAKRTISIRSRDGRPLAATYFHPATVHGCVVVCSAMATPRGYYEPFAQALAARGLAVVTFDYRDMGDSRETSLRKATATMEQWGLLDIPAAIEWIRERHPSIPMLALCHSAGGQLIGMADNVSELAGVLAVATQSGYWRLWPAPGRFAVLTLWWMLPAFAYTIGCFPGARFGIVGDLPGGVAKQWSSWGRHPEYLQRDKDKRPHDNYSNLAVPLRTYVVADDFIAPRPAAERWMTWFPKAQAELIELRPEEIGVTSIGHFGFFRRRFRDSLWAPALDWIDQVVHSKS